MHCHLDKKTALVVLSGKAVCSTLENGYDLHEGDGLVLDKKVFHSTQAISSDGIFLIEVETPVKKTDLLRLSDTYGRETKGYESQQAMSSPESRYQHITFSENEYNTIKKLGNMHLTLHIVDTTTPITSYCTPSQNGTLILLRGTITNDHNGKIYEKGDMIPLTTFNTTTSFIHQNPVEILKIEKISNHVTTP